MVGSSSSSEFQLSIWSEQLDYITQQNPFLSITAITVI